MAAEGQNDIILNVTGNTRQLEKEIQRVASNNLVLNTKGFSQPLGKITGQLGEFEKSLAASNARVIAFGASAGAIYALQKAFGETVKSVIDVQKSLIEINAVLNVSQQNLGKFGNSLFDIAKNTGQTFSEVARSALEFSRQGLSVEETLKRTSDALILTRLSGMDVVDSTSAITAALNSFNQTAITSTDLINKLVAVDASFAVSSSDLAEAIKRVGSSAQDVGVNIDQLIAIVTAAQQTTARGGAVIGNSFKTIFTRLQRPKVLDALDELGVKTKDAGGNMMPLMQILSDLSLKFDGLAGSQRAQIAELIGGVYQINILKAALGDLSKQYSVYNQALNISSQATNQAQQRNDQYNQSLASLMNKTLANLTKAGSDIGNITVAPILEKSLNMLNSGLEFASSKNGDYEGVGANIGQGIAKGLSNFLGGPGLLLASAAIIKIFERLTKYSYDAFKSLSGIGVKSAEQQQLQSQILNLLSKNPAVIDQINKGTANTANIHRDLLSFIQAETIAMEKQLAVASNLAKTLMQSGVRVPQSGDYKGMPIKQMKAFGFIPNFNYEEAETFGAALGGYKAGRVRTMNMPEEGRIFYNDSESIVKIPGFSQPAIMPPKDSKAGENYKKTFENRYGFNPYKSLGFIPNFSRDSWRGSKGVLDSKTLQKGFSFSSEKLVYEKGWVRLSGKLAEEALTNRGQKILAQNNIQTGTLINDEGDRVVFAKSTTSNQLGDAQKVSNILQKSFSQVQQDSAASKLKGDNLSENIKDYSSKYVLVYPGFGNISKESSYGIDKNSGEKYSFTTYPFPGPNSEINIGEDVYKSARENIVDLSKSFISKLSTNPKMWNTEEFERGVQSNLGIDTISAFVGSAFEAGLKASISSVSQTRTENFDLSKEELKRLDAAYKFKKEQALEVYEEGDLKNSLSPGNLNSMAEKIGRKAGGTQTKSLAGSNKGFEGVYPKESNMNRGKYKGFIPNFSAIKDAINREEDVSGRRARVLWSNTLGTPVVVNDKQTAEYGSNADKIIYNDHIKQGQYASYDNLMKTGSGKEKYKSYGFIPNFASAGVGERYSGLSNIDIKDILDARKSGLANLKSASEKLRAALEDAQATVIKSDGSFKSFDVALKKAVLKFNLTSTEAETLNRNLNSTSSMFNIAKGKMGKFFDDTAITGSALKQFKDKAIFASFGLSMVGGFAQSLAGDNKQLSGFFGDLTQSLNTATTVMGLIPGQAGIFAGALIGAGGALEAVWHIFNDKAPDLERSLELITQASTDFGNSTSKYLSVNQKLDEAIKNKASVNDIQKLNEDLLGAANELPAAYRAQLLAITDNVKLQEKINEIQKELSDKKENLAFLTSSQKDLDTENSLLGNTMEGIFAGIKYTINGRNSFEANQFDRQNLIFNNAAALNKGAAGILTGMPEENRKQFLKDIGNQENAKKYFSMDKTAFSNELSKNYKLNFETKSLLEGINDQEFQNLRAKIIQMGSDSAASAKLIESITEARKEYDKTLAEEESKILAAKESLEKFKDSLTSLTEQAIKSGSFSKAYQNQQEANKRGIEIQKLSGMLDYSKPFMTESATSKLDYEIGQLRRNEEFINAAQEIQNQTREQVLDIGSKIIENAAKGSDSKEGSRSADEESLNRFRIALAEISQNKNMTNQDVGQAIKSAYQEIFKNTLTAGDVKELNQNIDQLISEQGQSLLSLNQKLDIGNKIAEEQLAASLKQQEYSRQIKSFGGISAFLDQEGSSKKQSERLTNIQRFNYIKGFNSLDVNSNTRNLPMSDYIELVNQTNEDYQKATEAMEKQGKSIANPQKLYSELFESNQSQYASKLLDGGIGIGRYALQAAVDAKEMTGGISPEDARGYERVKNLAIEGRTQDIMRQSSQMAAALRGAGMNELATVYDKRARGDVAREIATNQINEAINSEDTGKNVKAILDEVKKITSKENESAKSSGLSQDFISAMQNLNRDFTTEMRNLISQVKNSANLLDEQTKRSDLVKEAAGIKYKLITSQEDTAIARQQISEKSSQLTSVGITEPTKKFILDEINSTLQTPGAKVPTIQELATKARGRTSDNIIDGKFWDAEAGKIAEELSRMANQGNSQDEKTTALNSLLETYKRLDYNQTSSVRDSAKLDEINQKLSNLPQIQSPLQNLSANQPQQIIQNPISYNPYGMQNLNMNPYSFQANIPFGLQNQYYNSNQNAQYQQQNNLGPNFDALTTILKDLTSSLNQTKPNQTEESDKVLNVNFGQMPRVEGKVEMVVTSKGPLEIKIEEKSLEKVVKELYDKLDDKFTNMIEDVKRQIQSMNSSIFRLNGGMGIPQNTPKINNVNSKIKY